jgi:hypothetical protein
MSGHPSTEEIKNTFNYVDGCLYWKIKPAVAVSIGDKAGSLHKKTGYMQVSYKNKRYLLHRLIWVWHGNELSKELEIDHINRNKQDNRIENLRQVTRKENRKNRKADYVCFDKAANKWYAYTSKNCLKGRKFLGYYNTKEEEAVSVVNKLQYNK